MSDCFQLGIQSCFLSPCSHPVIVSSETLLLTSADTVTAQMSSLKLALVYDYAPIALLLILCHLSVRKVSFYQTETFAFSFCISFYIFSFFYPSFFTFSTPLKVNKVKYFKLSYFGVLITFSIFLVRTNFSVLET